MQQGNHRLLGHCKRLERQKDVVMAQVAAMRDKWSEAEATRTHLQNEVDTLRKTLEVRYFILQLQYWCQLPTEVLSGVGAHVGFVEPGRSRPLGASQ